jgi:hypothetical protein
MSRIGRMLQDSEVIYDLTLNVINTVFLVGKLTSRVPELITNLAYTSLKFVGMIYLHAQLQALAKNCRDSLHAGRHRAWSSFAYVTAMTFVQGSGVILTVGGTVASICITLSQLTTARLIYTVLRPWGLVALAIQLLLEVVCHLTDDALLARMERVSKRSWETLVLFQTYQPGARRSEKSDLAAAVRRRIDPATWKTLEDKALLILQQRAQYPGYRLIARWRLQRLFKVAIENIRTQRNAARADASLRVVGYVAYAITRANPHTLIEAIVNWSISAFYTSRDYIKKWQEAGQQEAIGRV